MNRKKSPRHNRRDKTEVSCCIKYLMFGFNVLFWLIGAGICAIGLWAWTEKDMFNNISKLTNITLDPALLFILIGGLMFVIGFSGCLGALRENTCLLAFFCITVGLIFLGELVIGVLGFIYKDWVKSQIESQVKDMIINYREDADLQNLVDWVPKDWITQAIYSNTLLFLFVIMPMATQLYCCGVKDYKDWESNRYFNCSSPGIEACGVPFSCCRPTSAVIENRHCGYEMIGSKHNSDRDSYIYTVGCIPAGEKWLESNLIPVASVAVGIAVLQILGICFAHNLRSDIKTQLSKWEY